MNDFFQQFEEHKKISESLFNNIFNKKSTQPIKKNGPQILQNSNNGITIKFENGSIADEVNTIAALPFLEKLDFNSSKFNFLNLPGVNFHATYLELNLKTQEVDNFNGKWNSGPFKGNNFEGIFNGSSFHGNFIGKYTDWESHPTAFVDGTFIDSTDSGLLGKPNIITLPDTASDDNHLVFIPEGYYLQFRSKNGITGYIKVLKRLNNVNSDFKYEILDGFKGQHTPEITNFSWTEIRQSWNNLFLDPTNTKNIVGLIEVPAGDYIEELYISTAPATFQKPVLQFNPKTKYIFNLSKIPDLNIKTLKGPNGKFVKPEVNLKFKSKEYFNKFEEVLSNIQSGTFEQDIDDIKKAIKYGQIDGYGQFSFLKFVFDDIPGTTPSTPTKSKKGTISEANGVLNSVKFKAPAVGSVEAKPTAAPETKYGIGSSMGRLNDFVKYFVENIVDKNGEPDTAIQNLIIARLKTAIGIEFIKKPTPKSTPIVPAKEPGMTSGDVKESVRFSVRNIINNSF